MGYTASFKTRVEREMVELARSLTGLSQSAYARAVLLKEAYTIVSRARQLETSRESAQAVVGRDSAAPSAGKGHSSNLVADTPTSTLDEGTGIQSSGQDDSQVGS